MFLFKFTNWMTNSAASDQMASSKSIWSGSTLFAKIGVVMNSRIRFNNLSVIPRWCLDMAGSLMPTFRVLPHWNIMPQTRHDIPPSHILLTLGWPVLALHSAEHQAKWLCWALTTRLSLWVILCQEKRDRWDSRGDEREGHGRKRKMNDSEETEEMIPFPLYYYLLQG